MRPGKWELNRPHPLAQGLAFLSLLDEKAGRPVDAISGAAPTAFGAAWGYNGLTHSGTGKFAEWTLAPVVTSNGLGTGDFTFFAMANPIAESTMRYLVSQKNDALGSPYTQASLLINGGYGQSSSLGRFALGTYSAGARGAQAQISSLLDGLPHLFAGVRSGDNHYLYFDGVLLTNEIAVNFAVGVSRVGQFIAVGSQGGSTSSAFNRQIQFAGAYNRALSPAEIAILADRTDPMLGGLIVDERPVLYFDMGGSADVTGPVVFQNSAAIGMSAAKQAVGADPLSHASAVSLAGEKSVNAPVPVSVVSSVGASGTKSVLYPAVFEHASGLGISGVKTENMLGGGDVIFEHASAVELAGQKQAVGWLGIVASSLIGISGSKEALMPELAGAYSVNNRTSVVRGGVYTNKSGGTLYAVLTLSGTKPSVAQVKAGQNHLGATAQYATSKTVSSVGLQTFEAWWLNPGTTFYWHFVWTDAEAEDSVVVTSPAVSTLAAVVGTKESFDGDFPSTQLEQSGTTAIVQNIKVVQ